MTPNKGLSDAMFIHYSNKGDVAEFDRVVTQDNLMPLFVKGKQLVVKLNQETTAKSRQKYGDRYIDFEVSRILLVHGIFHFHNNIQIRSEFTKMIFTTKIVLYVRP